MGLHCMVYGSILYGIKLKWIVSFLPKFCK